MINFHLILLLNNIQIFKLNVAKYLGSDFDITGLLGKST